MSLNNFIFAFRFYKLDAKVKCYYDTMLSWHYNRLLQYRHLLYAQFSSPNHSRQFVYKVDGNDDCTIVCNSVHVIDSERQRENMAEEFCNNYKRDIEMYQKSIQIFIDSGGTSPTVIERWIKKSLLLIKRKPLMRIF